jgi:N-dimethylarginine dimethylaminohydrolase
MFGSHPSIGARFVVSAPRCPATCTREPSGEGCAFKVAWRINPHMRIGAVTPLAATRQHAALTRLLQRLGARIDGIPFVHGAYDSVFVKDNAILLRRDGVDRALLARPRHHERQMEQMSRLRALSRQGFHVELASSGVFEGGDVVSLPVDGAALLGTGFRTEKRAAEDLARFLGVPVHPLELRDPYLYHLDTALSALGDGTVAFCPVAFTDRSRRRIEHLFSPERLIRVPYDDARGFAINTIEVGRHVILGGPSAWLERHLSQRGWTVHVPDLRQFRQAGGSAACLVAEVHRSLHDPAEHSPTGLPPVAA